MARRQTLWEHLRWDLLALAVIGLVAAGYTALQNPTFQPSESPKAPGSKPPDHSEGDVLLVLPTAPAAQADEFRNLDCSFAWFNALRQHFGTFATTPVENVSPQLLAGYSVVIVPSRLTTEASRAVREDLEAFAQQGGQLIVEMPRDDSWVPITGVTTSGETSPARSITAADGLGDNGPVQDHLVDVPLRGQLVEAPPMEPRPEGSVVFEVEQQPGVVAEPLGDGMVLTLLFDFACSLTAMFQGEPTEGMEFGEPDGPNRDFTAERIVDERLAETTVPYATVLQRALFDRLSELRPVARLWPFPADYAGAAITNHPAPEHPRPAFAFADRAHQQQASSTILAASDRFTADHAALAAQVDADVGLLWVLGEQRPPVTEGVGMGAIEPWLRELSLPRQHAELNQTLGTDDHPPHLVQTEQTLWTTDWDSTFRTLAAADLDVDTSFGPTAGDEYGYLFGTGMPFYPLDRRGRPIPVLEMPFALAGSNLSASRLESLLESSHEAFHQPVVANLAADAMARDPSVGLLMGFRDFHRLGRDYNHWLTTTGDFIEFQSARRRSVLTSQWSNESRRLTVSVNLVGLELPTAPDGAVASVAIPAQHRGAGIRRIDIDDDEVTIGEPTASGPGDEWIVELPPGRHVLSVYYHSSGDDP